MKRRDCYIIGAVLLLALAAYLATRLSQPAVPAYVTVYAGNAVYASVPVDAPRIIVVDQGDGKVNVVAIGADGVCMASSTCPNQLCVQQGVIDPSRRNDFPPGNRIICLPNGVTVALTDAEEPVQ